MRDSHAALVSDSVLRTPLSEAELGLQESLQKSIQKEPVAAGEVRFFLLADFAGAFSIIADGLQPGENINWMQKRLDLTDGVLMTRLSPLEFGFPTEGWLLNMVQNIYGIDGDAVRETPNESWVRYHGQVCLAIDVPLQLLEHPYTRHADYVQQGRNVHCFPKVLFDELGANLLSRDRIVFAFRTTNSVEPTFPDRCRLQQRAELAVRNADLFQASWLVQLGAIMDDQHKELFQNQLTLVASLSHTPRSMNEQHRDFLHNHLALMDSLLQTSSPAGQQHGANESREPVEQQATGRAAGKDGVFERSSDEINFSMSVQTAKGALAALLLFVFLLLIANSDSILSWTPPRNYHTSHAIQDSDDLRRHADQAALIRARADIVAARAQAARAQRARDVEERRTAAAEASARRSKAQANVARMQSLEAWRREKREASKLLEAQNRSAAAEAAVKQNVAETKATRSEIANASREKKLEDSKLAQVQHEAAAAEATAQQSSVIAKEARTESVEAWREVHLSASKLLQAQRQAAAARMEAREAWQREKLKSSELARAQRSIAAMEQAAKQRNSQDRESSATTQHSESPHANIARKEVPNQDADPQHGLLMSAVGILAFLVLFLSSINKQLRSQLADSHAYASHHHDQHFREPALAAPLLG